VNIDGFVQASKRNVIKIAAIKSRFFFAFMNKVGLITWKLLIFLSNFDILMTK
jgi:hypothetical protein